MNWDDPVGHAIVVPSNAESLEAMGLHYDAGADELDADERFIRGEYSAAQWWMSSGGHGFDARADEATYSPVIDVSSRIVDGATESRDSGGSAVLPGRRARSTPVPYGGQAPEAPGCPDSG